MILNLIIVLKLLFTWIGIDSPKNNLYFWSASDTTEASYRKCVLRYTSLSLFYLISEMMLACDTNISKNSLFFLGWDGLWASLLPQHPVCYIMRCKICLSITHMYTIISESSLAPVCKTMLLWTTWNTKIRISSLMDLWDPITAMNLLFNLRAVPQLSQAIHLSWI